MTLYGYARVSVGEPEDKNLHLQVDRLVRAGCALGVCPRISFGGEKRNDLIAFSTNMLTWACLMND